MTGQGNGKRSGNGRRPDEIVPAILREAFVHSLKVTKTTQGRAARSMCVSRATVERYVGAKDDVNAKHVLRSKKLWRPFWLCVGRLMHRARKAA